MFVKNIQPFVLLRYRTLLLNACLVVSKILDNLIVDKQRGGILTRRVQTAEFQQNSARMLGDGSKTAQSAKKQPYPRINGAVSNCKRLETKYKLARVSCLENFLFGTPLIPF
jgi:hypothetical protein